MADPPPKPRRTPGGFVPPRPARPTTPSSNGHAPHDRPLGLRRSAWQDIDDEDDVELAAKRVRFQRVADVDDTAQVRTSGRPSRAALIGALIVVAVVVLAVILYRMAPP
jgi:hypothetical protein